MTPAYGRGNVSGASKSHAPARVDLSDVQIPHRNSSSTVRDYVPPHQQVRAGGDAFLKIKSVGV